MFSNFIGYQKEKDLMKSIIDTYKNEDKYKRFGIKKIKSILLSGEFGVGKSTFVKDIIKEMNVKTFFFKYLKGKEESINELNSMFNEASKEKTSLLIIEDIDSFKDANKELFNIFLENIKEYKDKNILLIATFNHGYNFMHIYDFINKFDKNIHLYEPSKEDARKIIEYLLKGKSISPNFNYDDLNEAYFYKNGNSFNELINKSVINQGYQRRKYLETDDIIKTILKKGNTHKLSDNEIRGNALKKAGCLAIREILTKDSARFVSVSNLQERFYEECEEFSKNFYEIALVLSGAKAALDLFGDNNTKIDCNKELDSLIHKIQYLIEFDKNYQIGFFKESFTSNARDEKLEHIYEEKAKECVNKAKEMLLHNKEFVLKIYEELYKKHYLLWSDIRSIRDRYMIETNIIKND